MKLSKSRCLSECERFVLEKGKCEGDITNNNENKLFQRLSDILFVFKFCFGDKKIAALVFPNFFRFDDSYPLFEKWRVKH